MTMAETALKPKGDEAEDGRRHTGDSDPFSISATPSTSPTDATRSVAPRRYSDPVRCSNPMWRFRWDKGSVFVGGWRYLRSVTNDRQVAFTLEDGNHK